MELHVFKDAEAVSEAAAAFVAGHMRETLKTNSRYTIALSGGSTPKRLHQLLALSPYTNIRPDGQTASDNVKGEAIDWSKLHVFWGDERAVPFEDSRNNARMAYDTLLDLVPIPADQIHVMRTDIPPDESATEYEAILHRYFDNTATSFDLVLLGMGDDGHTLSLFPGQPVVHEEKRWATAFFLQAQDMYRITLTKTIVNRSACVAFLTTGAAKAKALREVLQGKPDPDLYPSQVIKPLGELHWFVDEAAAADLK